MGKSKIYQDSIDTDEIIYEHFTHRKLIFKMTENIATDTTNTSGHVVNTNITVTCVVWVFDNTPSKYDNVMIVKTTGNLYSKW